MEVTYGSSSHCPLSLLGQSAVVSPWARTTTTLRAASRAAGKKKKILQGNIIKAAT